MNKGQGTDGQVHGLKSMIQKESEDVDEKEEGVGGGANADLKKLAYFNSNVNGKCDHHSGKEETHFVYLKK